MDEFSVIDYARHQGELLLKKVLHIQGQVSQQGLRNGCTWMLGCDTQEACPELNSTRSHQCSHSAPAASVHRAMMLDN